jgi:hypothetical protein
MKRFLVVFLIVGLFAGSVATAEAKRKKPTRVERTVEGNYGALPQFGCNVDIGSFAWCMVVDTRPTEAFFTAKVTDAHGQPVFVQVIDGGGGRIGTFCGETTRPVSFDAGSSLEFRIEPTPYFFSNWGTEWLGPLDCPYRIKTSGSISVTLSNVR